jgi:hypothetical protein
MFGGVGVGADERQYHVCVVCPGRPHLLSVDHEVVAVTHRSGPKRGQIGAGTRLAHPQRCGDLGTQDRYRPLLLLLGRAEGDERRGDDPDALRVEARDDPAAAQLRLQDVLLQDRCVPAAELRRVARHQPAVVELQPLPPPGPVRHV